MLKIKKSLASVTAKIMLIFVMVAAFSIPALALDKSGENNAFAATNNCVTVCPNSAKMLVNGANTACNSCNVGGNNYVKLRDVACLLDNTKSCFNVGYDSNSNCVKLTTNCKYSQAVNGCSTNNCKSTTAKCANVKVKVDGKAINLKSCNVNGCNYFKLRDLAAALSFNCGNIGKTVLINCNGSNCNQGYPNSGSGNSNNSGSDSSSNSGSNSGSTGNTIDPENASQAELVLYYTNQERAKYGLTELTTMSSLDAAAAVRAKEIATSFSHTRPNGATCFTVLSGINYSTAGENIAMGQPDAKSVVAGWMNSPGHRANILNANYTKLGVGVYKVNGNMYWSQEFIGN